MGTAVLEAAWIDESGEPCCTVDAGGGAKDVILATTVGTHQAIAAALLAAINTACGAGTCTAAAVDSTTGALTLTFGGNYDVAVNPPLATFFSLSASYLAVGSITGGTYPPAQYRPGRPLPEPDPILEYQREGVVRSDGATVSYLVDIHSIQTVTLHWREPVTGCTWSQLAAFISGYVLPGVPIRIGRDSAIVAAYTLWISPSQTRGYSIGTITAKAAAKLSRRLSPSTCDAFGSVSFEMRLTEGTGI